MSSLIVTALLFQAVIPVLLIIWVAVGWNRPRVLLVLDALIAAAYVGAIALAGLWLALPHWLPQLYILLLGMAAVGALVHGKQRPPSHPIAIAARAIILLAVAVVATYGQRGHRMPSDVVELEFPLTSGDYLVGNGGTNILINAHYATLRAGDYRAYRGQSYGVDIVGIGEWGSRKSGLSPEDPARYAIFGTYVISPCDGEIMVAVDGHPDMPVPQHDRAHMEGNHLIVSCGDVWVVLAHLREGSVRHAAGAHVRTGDVLGEVGNSGNTDEPHLHVHVQRPGTAEAPLGGEPLPVRFGKQWLTRNMRLTCAD